MRLSPAMLLGGGIVAFALLSRARAATSHVVDDGRVSSPFGCRTRAGYECGPCGAGKQFHLGVDIAASEGKPVRAPIAGIVIKTVPDGTWTKYGNVVLVAHPQGVTTLYAHLARIDVHAGQRVNAGDVLGFVGRTGVQESGPHVHFEVLQKANATSVSGFTVYRDGQAVGCKQEDPRRVEPIAWLASVGAKAAA